MDGGLIINKIMYFKFRLQSELSNKELDAIINLKKNHWDYSYMEHFNWIKNNIKSDDIHVLMFEDELLVAYLNLINAKVGLSAGRSNIKVSFTAVWFVPKSKTNIDLLLLLLL